MVRKIVKTETVDDLVSRFGLELAENNGFKKGELRAYFFKGDNEISIYLGRGDFREVARTYVRDASDFKVPPTRSVEVRKIEMGFFGSYSL